MKRVLAVAVALFVTCGVAPVVLAGDGSAGQASGATPVDGCTNITSSGQYELTGDVGGNATTSCIEIRADDVVLDGNGHAVEGPGVETVDDDEVSRGIYVYRSDGVVVRNVAVSGWSPGIRSEGSEVAIEDAVVRDSEVGLFLEETGATDLSNVTVENSEGPGIDAHRLGDLQATDVTLRGNEVGIQTWDAHGLDVEDSRIVGNDGNGVNLHHHSTLNLTDSTVDGNGGDGIEARAHSGFRADLRVDGGTVSNNGADGVDAIGGATVELTGVSVADNDGVEVGGVWRESDDAQPSVTASDLDVGPAATTAFENESIDLEPVAADALPVLPAAESAAGDALGVSGDVDGEIDLELDVEADAERVDLWRYDGTDWGVVETDRAVTGGAIEATVERNGTYAPVDRGQSGGSGEATPTDEGGSDTTSTPAPGDQEASESTPTPTATSTDDGSSGEPTPSDDGSSGEPTSPDGGSSDDSSPSDDGSSDDSTSPNGGSSDDSTSTDDGSDDDSTSTDPSDSDSRDDSSGEDGSSGSSGSPASGTATATPDETATEDESSNASADAGTGSTPGDDGQQSEDAASDGVADASSDGASTETVDEESGFALADGAGFGVVAALLALASIALLARRR